MFIIVFLLYICVSNLFSTVVSMIPDTKQLAVANALQAAFGVSTFDDIQVLTKGLSGSLVFKITLQGNPYLLRVVSRTDTRDNPTQYFNSMQAAAAAGIAPKVHYVNVDDKVSLTDFIVEKPFPVAEAREMMAKLIGRVHALPKFSHQVDYVAVADGFFRRFQESDVLSERVPKELLTSYGRIGKVYPRNDESAIVSAHNDLKRDNILFDGERAWLVDWEAAFSNDRYVDLAAMANFVVRSDEDEMHFLNNYFGKEPDEYQRARFFLMSQIIHMFCFTLCMSLIPDNLKNEDAEPVDFRTFHDRLWNNEISLASAEAKRQYALCHMQQLEKNLSSRRFEDSMNIVAGATANHQ
jgi:thiamine kinase-like enzyme